MHIEVRLKAHNTFPHRGDFDESRSYSLHVPENVNANDILNALIKQGAIDEYITGHDVTAITRNKNPLIETTLNQAGEFFISLPSSVIGRMYFNVRIIHADTSDEI